MFLFSQTSFSFSLSLGRGDWEVAEQFNAGLEAVELLAGFFGKVAGVAESKL